MVKYYFELDVFYLNKRNKTKPKVILTSIVSQFLHIGNSFSYILLCCLGKKVPPGDNRMVKQDESEVVFTVEVIQNGYQSVPGLQKVSKFTCEYVQTMMCPVWKLTPYFTCSIFSPLIDPLLSITNTTFFGTVGSLGGAKKCTK